MASVVVQAGQHLVISADPLPLRKSIISGQISNLAARITVAHVFSTPAIDATDVAWDGKAVFSLPAYIGVLSGLQVSILTRTADERETRLSVPAGIRRKQDLESVPECVELKKHAPFESPDLCLVSVENVPRGVDVEIRATFVTEVLADGHDLSLILPTVLVPTLYKHAIASNPHAVVKPPGTPSVELFVDLQLKLFGAISAVVSPSKHPIHFTPTPADPMTGRGIVGGHIGLRQGVTDPFPHAGDLVLLFQMAQPIDRLLPRCFLEFAEGKDHPIVAMLAFKPKVRFN